MQEIGSRAYLAMELLNDLLDLLSVYSQLWCNAFSFLNQLGKTQSKNG